MKASGKLSALLLFMGAFIVLALCIPGDGWAREMKKPAAAKITEISEDLIIVDLRSRGLTPSSRRSVRTVAAAQNSVTWAGDVTVIDLARENGRPHLESPRGRGTKVVIFEGDPPAIAGKFQGLTDTCDDGKYLPLISEIASRYNIDPQLVKIIIEVESGFNPNACSSQNAMGLMQIIPETAESLNLNDPYDPYENILAGVRYLRLQLDRFGCIELALAAYNAGPGAVEKYGGIPPYEETQNYVRTIMDRYYNGN